MPKDKLLAKLWGDNFFNPATRKWGTKSSDAEGKPLGRFFNMFVLEPIFKIVDAVMNSKKDQIGPYQGHPARSRDVVCQSVVNYLITVDSVRIDNKMNMDNGTHLGVHHHGATSSLDSVSTSLPLAELPLS